MVKEKTHWVKRPWHGRVSRFPELFRQELNASAIEAGLAGLATKDYYKLLFEKEDD